MGSSAGSPQNHVRDPQKVLPLRLPKQYADLLKELEPSVRKAGIDEMMLVNTRDIAVAEWVHWKCKFGCKYYGKSWCCPPETPTPDQARGILLEYEKAILLCGSGENINHHKDNHQKRRKQVHVWKGTVALERQLFLLGYYKAFALVSESCALCKECGYPHECKFPMNRRPSVESFSIDVFQTLNNVGKRFQIAKDILEPHNSYSIILLE
jgi:predicted metal-binding protein